MHELDEAEEDEQPLADVFPSVAGGRNPRQFTVLIDDPSTGGVPDPAYPVGIFEVSGGADSEPLLGCCYSCCGFGGAPAHCNSSGSLASYYSPTSPS